MRTRSSRSILAMPALALCMAQLPPCAGCGCNTSSIVGDDDANGDSPWDPPIENLGETGWGDSTVPWCSGSSRPLESYDVWSRPGAVYVLGSRIEGCGSSSEPCDQYGNIYRNIGEGWEPMLSADIGAMGGTIDGGSIMGSGGDRLLVGRWSMDCGILSVDGGTYACFVEEEVQDIFVVDEGLAYAIKMDQIIYYNGTSWGPLPAPFPPMGMHRIWADGSDVFCAGEGGTVVSLEAGDWRVHDTHTLDTITALWGFTGTDVWAGTSRGAILHFDGSDWSEVTWAGPDLDCDCCGGSEIEGMWGSGGTIFFHTGTAIATGGEEGFVTLGYWPPTRAGLACRSSLWIEGIWGNSTEEVFIAVRDFEREGASCGSESLMWWDGEEFHWF